MLYLSASHFYFLGIVRRTAIIGAFSLLSEVLFLKKAMKSFASDNYSGVHPTIMEAIIQANDGHVSSYGNDDYTRRAELLFKKHFGEQAEAFFVFLGTAANVLCLSAAAKPFEAIICTDLAHINVDECGAPERFGGFKLLTVPTLDGKLDINLAKKHLENVGFEHHVQPRIISISQTTELGTVYTPQEIAEIADFAHQNGLLLHVDGARLSNAAAALGLPFKAFTTDLGVDLLSFGGTKNGMMFGEAVVFLNPSLSKGFKYLRKQSMQLASKMRFISAQFEAYLSNDQCINTASHANKMAKYLAESVKDIPQVKITQSVDANAVFAIFPKEITPVLQETSFFYLWNESLNEARWMASWDISESDIDHFVKKIVEALKDVNFFAER